MANLTYSNATTWGQWVSLAERQLRKSGALEIPEKMYNGAAAAANGTRRECGKLWRDTFGPDKPQTNSDKAMQNSMRANVRHNIEDVERIYEQPKQSKQRQHAQLDSVQDIVTFSPEALALRGC